MATRRKKRSKALRIPRGLPGAGQYASKELIEALKFERYLALHPRFKPTPPPRKPRRKKRELIIEIPEVETPDILDTPPNSWSTLEELRLKLEHAILTTPYELGIMDRTGEGMPLRDIEFFGSEDLHYDYETIQIDFKKPITTVDFQKISDLVWEHIKGHYNSRPALIGFRMAKGEMTVHDTLSGRKFREKVEVGWRQLTSTWRIEDTFEQVRSEISRMMDSKYGGAPIMAFNVRIKRVF